MQAVEKFAHNTNWLTLVFMLLLCFVAVLKALDTNKLRFFFNALLHKHFIEEEIEEKSSFLNPFYIVLFLFSSTTFALVLTWVFSKYTTNIVFSFKQFTPILAFTILYFLTKKIIDYFITNIFILNNTLRPFKVAKQTYLYALSFIVFFLFVVFKYAHFSIEFFLILVGILFILRFILTLLLNKKLIFSNLFYIILYLCALEISPLVILLKVML